MGKMYCLFVYLRLNSCRICYDETFHIAKWRRNLLLGTCRKIGKSCQSGFVTRKIMQCMINKHRIVILWTSIHFLCLLFNLILDIGWAGTKEPNMTNNYNSTLQIDIFNFHKTFKNEIWLIIL